jgi:flagellar basal-body rod protein FlgB
MPAIIDNNMVSLLSLALDAAGMRQQAIAHNIANANTPGFQRVAVSFEQQVAALQSRGLRQAGSAAPSLADLAAMRPRFVAADPAGADATVALDQEVAHLVETTVHHQALLKALNSQFTLLGSAINEGKR